MDRIKILLTNDDGIHSAGLRYLWEALKGKVDLFIAAPQEERSGFGAAVTMGGPLRVESVDLYPGTLAWKIGGTPADCVRLALSTLLPSRPDFIFSGINHGSNAGRNIFYSGTVGGVIQGVLHSGIPGIAFSYFDETPSFPQVKQFIPQIVDYIVDHPLPEGTFLNVNFPALPASEVKGYKMARQGKSYWIETATKNLQTDNHTVYWLEGAGTICDEHEESDIALLEQGYITAVPLHINELTDQRHFIHAKVAFEKTLNSPLIKPSEAEQPEAKLKELEDEFA
ncbi:MAG: 5'/3'-nucleotidase SurE [Chlamydiota bacterium]